MRLFRGLTVPSERAADIVAEIRQSGITTNSWRWQTVHLKPDPALLERPTLTLADTRPKGAEWNPAACACGDRDGAYYYAFRHNRHGSDDTPIIVEFDSSADTVAIDGKDCLYTVVQMGDPIRARPFIRAAFGEKGLQYAEQAWQSDDPAHRIALCDLMIHDSEVVEAHHRNRLVIAGRFGTVFRSAFTVALPILPQSLDKVWIPDEISVIPRADVLFEQLLRSS